MGNNSWDFNSALNALKKFNLAEFENIFIHSNLSFLGKPRSVEKPATLILDALINLTQDKTNLIFPGFTYSFGKDEIFDKQSLSGLNEMGSLSIEAFNRRFETSSDPMFRLIGIGPTVKEFILCDNKNSFGEGSSFRKILNSNTLILLICVGGGSTLVHEIEHELKVPYRFEKKFFGRILNDQGAIVETDWTIYVRDLQEKSSEANFSKLTKLIYDSEFLIQSNLGRGYIFGISADNLISLIKKNISVEPTLLINT